MIKFGRSIECVDMNIDVMSIERPQSAAASIPISTNHLNPSSAFGLLDRTQTYHCYLIAPILTRFLLHSER
jgi:hypothetical protein